MKVIYNAQYGGFGISFFAAMKLIERLGIAMYVYKFDHNDENGKEIYVRVNSEYDKPVALYLAKFFNQDFGEVLTEDDIVGEVAASQISYGANILFQHSRLRVLPELVQLIEEYSSEKISGDCAALAIKDIPKGSFFRIEEYDVYESIKDIYMDDNIYYAYE